MMSGVRTASTQSPWALWLLLVHMASTQLPLLLRLLLVHTLSVSIQMSLRLGGQVELAVFDAADERFPLGVGVAEDRPVRVFAVTHQHASASVGHFHTIVPAVAVAAGGFLPVDGVHGGTLPAGWLLPHGFSRHRPALSLVVGPDRHRLVLHLGGLPGVRGELGA